MKPSVPWQLVPKPAALPPLLRGVRSWGTALGTYSYTRILGHILTDEDDLPGQMKAISDPTLDQITWLETLKCWWEKFYVKKNTLVLFPSKILCQHFSKNLRDLRFADYQILMKSLKAQDRIFHKVHNSRGLMSLRHSQSPVHNYQNITSYSLHSKGKYWCLWFQIVFCTSYCGQ